MATYPTPLASTELLRLLEAVLRVSVREGTVRSASPTRPEASVMRTLWVPAVRVVASLGILKLATKLPLLSVATVVTADPEVSVDTSEPPTVIVETVLLPVKPLALTVIS